MTRRNVLFWLFIISLNCILFLPKYLLELQTTAFFPSPYLMDGLGFNLLKSLFIRYNYDIFRISVDLFIILVAFYFLRKKININRYAWFAAIYYMIIFLFIIYYTAFEKIYLIKPVLYDDRYLLKLGFQNGSGNLNLILLLEIILLLLIIWLLKKWFLYLFTLLKEIQFGLKSKLFVYFIALLILINTFKSGITFESQHTIQASLFMIIDNVTYSIQAYNNLNQLDIYTMNQKINYDQYRLKKRPNVYFLFIESYGKIMYENPKLWPSYHVLIDEYEQKLKKYGFYSYTNSSISPVSGGGSWISYSSVMFGFNLKNQATYLSMMKKSSTINYNHMFRWFKHNGYRNYRLTSIQENENLRTPWSLYYRFYGTDEWIRYDDLHYQGPLYGFGPSPPDQYSIAFANDYIEKKGITPYTFFFITQNSHNPFYSPDSLVTNWKTLNNSESNDSQKSILFKNPTYTNYDHSIEYDMKVLFQFILQHGKENDLFFLIGDHQPPILTSDDDGFNTPVHIIVKDSTFGKGFMKYDFHPGLTITKNQKPIRHEAIYSMLTRELIRNYGIDTTHLPEYRPFGIKVNERP